MTADANDLDTGMTIIDAIEHEHVFASCRTKDLSTVTCSSKPAKVTTPFGSSIIRAARQSPIRSSGANSSARRKTPAASRTSAPRHSEVDFHAGQPSKQCRAPSCSRQIKRTRSRGRDNATPSITAPPLETRRGKAHSTRGHSAGKIPRIRPPERRRAL